MKTAHDKAIGLAMHKRLTELYPICRSITGDGVRKTLSNIKSSVPLEIHEVPSGTKVFDWIVPNEWNIRDAWIKNAASEKVVDFKRHSLHIVNYSTPIHKTMSLSELKTRLHSLPDQPDSIPYRTSYYEEDWGFCLSHNTLLSLSDGDYEVCIDSSLGPGNLTYGEFFLPGAVSDEVLFSAHVCHPSLANDNLSGIVVAAALAEQLAQMDQLHYSYRFLFVPATIGTIAWLSRNTAGAKRIRHGLVLSGLGDAGNMTYKRSRQESATIDRVLANVLLSNGSAHTLERFSPTGYDERQYCSNGFNLPVGRLSRTPYGTYRQYHTSEDNPDFIQPESLAESLRILRGVIRVLESNHVYVNTQPMCEPQLGRRGLYGLLHDKVEAIAMLWILNLADGHSTLLDISERSSIPFDCIQRVASVLELKGLLRKAN